MRPTLYQQQSHTATSTESHSYLKGVEIEVGRAWSEQPVNLLLGGQHRVPLLNLLHLMKENIFISTTPAISISYLKLTARHSNISYISWDCHCTVVKLTGGLLSSNRAMGNAINYLSLSPKIRTRPGRLVDSLFV